MGAGMNKLAGLVVGSRPTVSMGRVLLWIFAALAIYFWLSRPVEAFPPSLETALGFALAYNLGGKAVNNLSRRGRPEPMGKAYDDGHED